MTTTTHMHVIRPRLLPGASRRRSDGFTIIELLVTMGIAGILMGVALGHADPGRYNLWQTQTQLLGDMRIARTNALTKGVHYQVQVTSASTYVINRMKQAGVAWIFDTAVVSRSLPSGVVFTAGIGNPFEFNTRGMLILPGQAATLTVKDAHTTLTKNVTVWPSGQVAPL